MKTSQKWIIGLLTAAVLLSGCNVGMALSQHHRPWSQMAPGGHVYTDSTYDAVVNDAGGRNLDHEFIYGTYNHGAFYPTGQVFKW